MNYGKALKVARAIAELQQNELAARAGIDPSHISLIEKGTRKPSVRTIERLTRALRIPNHLFMLLASDPGDLRVGGSSGLESAAQALARFMLQNVSKKKSRTDSSR